jgi:hypothetical protein
VVNAADTNKVVFFMINLLLLYKDSSLYGKNTIGKLIYFNYQVLIQCHHKTCGTC